MGSQYVDKNKGHVFLGLSQFTLIIFFQTIQATGLHFFLKKCQILMKLLIIEMQQSLSIKLIYCEAIFFRSELWHLLGWTAHWL